MGFFKRKARSDDEAPAVASEPTGSMEELQQEAVDLASRLRSQPLNRESLRDITKIARDMQAGARASMQAAQDAQQPGATVGSLLAAIGMDWSTDYIKRVVCPVCGGPKKRPSPSAYVYCDYCGSLADFDFRTACADQSLKMPGPEYRNLVNGAQPRLQAAKAAGDRDQYAAIQREIFDGYATNVPKACSHRVADPDYKTAYATYMAQTSTTCDFDPEYTALMAEMTAAVGNMAWTGGMMSRKTGGPTFWALVDVVQRQQARARQVTSGLVDIDPDHALDEVRIQMANSLFCQGWLPFLDEDDAKRLVDELKLAGEYTKIEPLAEGETRSCGGCGSAISELSGAKRMICDHCGRSLDVGGAQAPCPGCGGRLTFPTGVTHLTCPFCKTENDRVGLT